jgi:hypothetical protein
LRAAHTPNFPALLRQLGASLLVPAEGLAEVSATVRAAGPA